MFFSTFAPNPVTANVCLPSTGTGRLYVIDLFNAAASRDLDGDDDFERFQDLLVIVIPDAPTPHIGEDGEIRLLLPTGTSGGSASSPFETGTSIDRPHASYWYREEY